jgi:hypothetical protein
LVDGSAPSATGAIIPSLPPDKAGVGSLVNDLHRELGEAFGIGVLGSITLSHFQSNLAPALSGRSHGVAAPARLDLAQALGVAGGADTLLGKAAGDAYGSALDLAWVGAAIGVIAATAVYAAHGSPASPLGSSPDDSLRTPEVAR